MWRASSHLLLTAALLLSALALRVWDPEPVARLRSSVFDTYLRASPREADPLFPVRIVDIDEASLARLGQWPWPRTRLATIIAQLHTAGALTITLDLILAEPDRLSPAEFARLFTDIPDFAPLARAAAQFPSNDERLAQAIAEAPVVLGFVAGNQNANDPGVPHARFVFSGDDPQQFVPSFSGGIGSLPALTQKAAGLGGVNWLPTQDQIVRRVPMLLSVAGKLYPSLPLEALRIASTDSTIFIRSSGGSGVLSFGQKTGVESIRAGTTVVPTDSSGELWLRFAASDPRRYVPAHRILDGAFDAKDIAGRHILIGASASGLLDLRATPLDASVPGVEIHAQALEQILSGDHLVRPDLATGSELVFLLAMGAVVAWLIRRSGPVTAALAGAAAIVAVTAGSWLAYSKAGLLFDPVYPALSIVVLYMAGSLYSYVKSEADRSRVRSAFSHYVAAPLVDELANNIDKLKLGGETREVTILFADVRGFSKISEGLDAEELIRFVNRLFTPLADIILDERGTIDKFMGDAVMAFWNAPLADPDHAGNACRAALRMISELENLNRSWAETAPEAGHSHHRVRIGIGLNSGPCCAGNVGSPQRFDYSILGDAVNVASRFEEATKIYGVPIIAGERTMQQAPELAWLEIEAAMLRGKGRAENMFALIGDERVAQTSRFIELRKAHAMLMEALHNPDAGAANEMLASCRSLSSPEFSQLYDHFEARLRRQLV